VLILLECNGQKYAVLTEQVRVPVGKFLLELPAGMLDDEKGDFVGTAVREVSILGSWLLNTAGILFLPGSEFRLNKPALYWSCFSWLWFRLNKPHNTLLLQLKIT